MLLGDGPVAVALVVRWSACRALRGGIGGGREGGREGEGGGRRQRQEQTVDSESLMVRRRVGLVRPGFSSVGAGDPSSDECLSD